MKKSMDDWFFMRPGFDTFQLEPDRHKQYLFGHRERRQRDLLMNDVENAVYAMDGHKAVVFGDYGRGKTHMCHNLAYELERRGDDVLPIYVKCSSYGSKEPFHSLFRELVAGIKVERINRVADEYMRRANRGEAPKIDEIVQSDDIALVMSRGLTAAETDVVRSSMRWLGGEPKVDMGLVSKGLRPQLSDSREFGAVLKGLAHMLRTVEGKVPVYLIDEAERLQYVNNVDTFAAWNAALRELTELPKVGLLFFVGALTRNDLPTLLLLDEIKRRIGIVNYVEFVNPSRDEIRDFLVELFATSIRKGAVPSEHAAAVGAGGDDTSIPEELQRLTAGDPKALETYPFTPDAFAEFVEQVSTGEAASKPSEVLKRVQKVAQRAMRADARVIDVRLVDALAAEGM
jgi:Cdc6-like AAA superfamily ATPase